jgi:hypothetical protein
VGAEHEARPFADELLMHPSLIAARNVVVGVLGIVAFPLLLPCVLVYGVFYVLYMLGTWIMDGAPTEGGW